MKIDSSGLDLIMSQMILYICNGPSLVEHVYSPGMAETVNRVYGL